MVMIFRENRSKFSFTFIWYRLKLFLIKVLKGIHNAFFALGIDIRLRKKDIVMDAVHYNSLDEVNKYYNNIEKQYEVTSEEHQKFFREIVKKLQLFSTDLNNKSIADFGCGVGNLLFHLKQNYTPSSLTGYDFSDLLLKLAKNRFPEGKFFHHDIYLRVESTFDFVFCTEVIEHLQYPGQAIQNILYAVNPGGGAFITVPDGRVDTYEGHINFWSPESWEVFIREKAGTDFIIETGRISPANLFAYLRKNDL